MEFRVQDAKRRASGKCRIVALLALVSAIVGRSDFVCVLVFQRGRVLAGLTWHRRVPQFTGLMFLGG